MRCVLSSLGQRPSQVQPSPIYTQLTPRSRTVRAPVRTYRHVRACTCAHVPLMLQAHEAPGLVLPAFRDLRPTRWRPKLISLIYTLLQRTIGQRRHVAAFKQPEAVSLVDYDQAV